MNLLFANDHKGEHPSSWYAATARGFPLQPPLKGDQRADVCVVGAGYTGLSAALHLARKGLRVIVLEAHRAGWGASGRNGGQVGSGQRQGQGWLEARMGKDDAKALWALAEEAKALVRDLIEAETMEGVDFRPGVAHACWRDSEAGAAADEADRLRRDYDYNLIEPLDRAGVARLTGSQAFAGGVLDRGAGHLHPLNFAQGLAHAARDAGAVIAETSLVLGIEQGTGAAVQALVRCQTGSVMADHVIVACNGYLGGLSPQVAARVMPINNFIIATEPLGTSAPMPEQIAMADKKFVVNYWRQTDDGRLLFGGGESYGYRFPDIASTVRKPLAEIYPELAKVPFSHVWGGTLAITATRMPCFMRLAPNILSASGYSGHGVAMATLAGRVLAEVVAGQTARFDLLARLPVPRFPGGAGLRQPLLALAMTWFSLRDRLGN